VRLGAAREYSTLSLCRTIFSEPPSITELWKTRFLLAIDDFFEKRFFIAMGKGLSCESTTV
jgi:hypothetical protein